MSNGETTPPLTLQTMTYFSAANQANIARLSEALLIEIFEDFDRIRRTASKQTTVDRAIAAMNFIAEELDRREA